LEAINSARGCINCPYIYWTGDTASKFADALAAKASDGVEVNVLLNTQGFAKMNHGIIDRMRAAGA
jgi:cardiolipin synthase A/B